MKLLPFILPAACQSPASLISTWSIIGGFCCWEAKFFHTCLPLSVPFDRRSITSIISEIKTVFDFSMLSISCDSRRNFFQTLLIFELILVLSLIKRSTNLRKMERVPLILISKRFMQVTRMSYKMYWESFLYTVKLYTFDRIYISM